MTDKRARLLGGRERQAALGIEIGALHCPLLFRGGSCRVLYVDYAPTDVLRGRLRHQGVDPASLVEVDVVWADVWGERSLAQAVGEPANLIVASHVAEHVPDLIGWLLALHGALRPGGTLGLALPDRRFTFDAWRNDSTIAELVEAHLLRRREPGLRQIFEAATHAVAGAPDEAWRPDGGAPLPGVVLDGLSDIHRWLAGTPALGYVDVHCWVFTPASLLRLAEALHRLGCFPWLIEAFHPTEPGQIEFQLRLRATVADDPAIAGAIAAARACLPDARPVAAPSPGRRGWIRRALMRPAGTRPAR